tara:strand:+ start:200 stop:553 length:354 start_codon:yes stop_codon:yes gene_type:complete
MMLSNNTLLGLLKGFKTGGAVDSLVFDSNISKTPKYTGFTLPQYEDNELSRYIRTLLSVIGKPALTERGLKFPYQRYTIPIGKKTSFTAERGLGLFGQEFLPDTNKRDLRFTLSRNF